MQEKQKVTLYLPPVLHRQLKIRSAVDTESMSAMVEKAIAFYLKHPDKVEEVEAAQGKTHQIHLCPECDAAMVMRDGQMVSLKNQPTVVDEDFSLGVRERVKSQANSQGEEDLLLAEVG
jgi:hypothetical protein